MEFIVLRLCKGKVQGVTIKIQKLTTENKFIL